MTNFITFLFYYLRQTISIAYLQNVKLVGFTMENSCLLNNSGTRRLQSPRLSHAMLTILQDFVNNTYQTLDVLSEK